MAYSLSYPGNKKIKYYYKLSEQEDLHDFVNSIFFSSGGYNLEQLNYNVPNAGYQKIVNVPVTNNNSAIVIDDEIEEGLYLVRIKLYNLNSSTTDVHPNFNSNLQNNDLTYQIPPNSIMEIYDLFTKEKGNVYFLNLFANLAILEFSLERVFEKGNRISIPQNLVNYAYTFGPGVINFRLRKGTYVIKIPYSYTNFSTSAYQNHGDLPVQIIYNNI